MTDDTSTTETKYVNVTTSDGATFKLKLDDAKKCVSLKNILEDLDEDDESPIPLSTIDKSTMEYVCRFIGELKELGIKEEMTEEEQITFRERDATEEEKKFFQFEDESQSFALILAANFLDNRPLLHSTAKYIANKMMGKTPEELKKMYKIERDFTDEEKEAVYAQYPILRDEDDDDASKKVEEVKEENA